MSEIEIPIWQRIGDFLKENPNIPYKIVDLVKNLGINNNSVRGRLSELVEGKKVIKKGEIVLTPTGKEKRSFYKGFRKGKIRKIDKGTYTYFIKDKFKSWKVDFKLIETNNPKPRSKWQEKMDFSGNASGIAPTSITKDKIIEIAGKKLAKISRKSAENFNIFLKKSTDIDSESSIYIGAELKDRNKVLDQKYNPNWAGSWNFIGDTGIRENQSVEFNISIGEWR